MNTPKVKQSIEERINGSSAVAAQMLTDLVDTNDVHYSYMAKLEKELERLEMCVKENNERCANIARHMGWKNAFQVHKKDKVYKFDENGHCHGPEEIVILSV